VIAHGTSSGSAVITIDSVAGIFAGFSVVGGNLPANTTVQSVDLANSKVTLTAAPPSSLSGTPLIFQGDVNATGIGRGSTCLASSSSTAAAFATRGLAGYNQTTARWEVASGNFSKIAAGIAAYAIPLDNVGLMNLYWAPNAAGTAAGGGAATPIANALATPPGNVQIPVYNWTVDKKFNANYTWTSGIAANDRLLAEYNAAEMRWYVIADQVPTVFCSVRTNKVGEVVK
jgi:hypothetical protein